MELVTVKTFDNAVDAHLAKTKLESEGVFCTLFDENIVGLNPLYNYTVGGIKLKVRATDLSFSSELLDQVLRNKVRDDQGEIITCPACKSDNIYSGYRSMKGARGMFSMLISFLFLVFPVFFKTVNKCKSCSYEF